MPEESSNQTPNTEETVPKDQTLEAGTEGQKAEDAPPAASPTSEEVDYKTKFTQSSQEAIRLHQENQRLQAILANTAAQQQAAQQQARQTQQQQQPEWDYNQLRDALLESDTGKLQNWEERIVQKAEQNISRRQASNDIRQMRIGASVQAFGDAFKDPKSPIGHEALKLYSQMVYDPSYSILMVPGDELEYPTPQGMVKINPHLMRVAVDRVRERMDKKSGDALSKAYEREGYIESAAGTANQAQAEKKFDSQRHMSQVERDFCDKIKQPYKEWWDFSRPALREARLKAGKPVSSKDQ